MSTSEALLDGLKSVTQLSTTPARKPLTVSASDDVSMHIETVSGRLVNVTNPSADSILLDDIAWALSRIPRFAGHTITEIPYNVAQHSVYVATLMEELLKSHEDFNLDFEVKKSLEKIHNNVDVLMKALLHDAHEAYTGDIPSPIKKIPELQETFKLIEQKLDHAIRTQFELDELTDAEKTVIKYCDKLAQAIEGYQFMPSRGFNWVLPKPTLMKLQKFPQPKEAIDSYKDFILHYEYLRDQ